METLLWLESETISPELDKPAAQGCWTAHFPLTPFPACPSYWRAYWEPLRLLFPNWGWTCQGLIPPLTALITGEMISTPVVMAYPWVWGMIDPGRGVDQK